VHVHDDVHVNEYVLVLVDVDGILEASSLIVRNEAELFHRIEVEGMNEFTVPHNRQTWKYRTYYAIMNDAHYFRERICPAMKRILRSLFRSLSVCIGLALVCASSPAQNVMSSGPINLDRAIEGQVATDRAKSYYHYSLSMWFDSEGDESKALSEMKDALKYNQNSSTVHVELARLLEKMGNIRDAVDHAQQAIRLDPKDPDPHWFLVDYYLGMQETKRVAEGSALQKAVEELEKLRDLTPSDERIYYDLGGAYFQLKQPQKAIQAFEKYQSLPTGSDRGYREIAKYYDQNKDPNKAIEYLNKGLAEHPNSIESLIMLGGLYIKQGNNKEAVTLYKRLLEITGNNVTVGRQVAASLYNAREYKESIPILKALISAAPTEKAYQILLGRALIGAREYSEAIKTLKAVEGSEAQFWLGVAYEESMKHVNAIEVYSRLMAKPPAGADDLRIARVTIQERLAECYSQTREYGKAISLYQEIVKTKPELNRRLLDVYRVSRQFEKAIPLGKQLYEKNPDNVELAIIYSQTLVDANRPQEGINILSRIYEKDQNDTDVAIPYARMLAEGGKLKEGVDILSRLLQANPQNIELHLNLSQVYIREKRYSDAEDILRRAEDKITDSKVSDELKFRRVMLCEKQKDFARAESLSKEILKSNPSNAPVLNYIGYMLADRGIRLDEAVRYVKEALALDPENGAYLDSLGWAFFRLNDLVNAEKYLLEADNNERNDPTIKEHLGDLYYKTGDLQKAEDFWTTSVRIGTDMGTEQEDVQKVRKKLEELQQTLQKQKPKK
jgi:tetratricopeptide (TPR) repeat protein